MNSIIIAVITGVLGLIVAAFLAYYVLKQPQGSKKVMEISNNIKEGALTFLGREYRILAIFVVVVTIILGVVPDLGWFVALVTTQQARQV